MKKLSLRVVVEIAIFAALGVALDALQGGMFRSIWTNGGSLGIAMIPVFIIAYRRGLVPGVLCGLLISLIQMLGGIYSVSGSKFDNAFLNVSAPFIQVMLDYVLTYTLVGVSGAFSKGYIRNENNNKKYLYICLGVIIGGLLKYLSHVGAGYFWLDKDITFWGVSGSSIIYAFVYNLYAVFNVIICLPIMILIARFYPQLLNPDYEDTLEMQDNEDFKEVSNND